MRWYVEISALGVKPGTTTTLCVEAPQWQPALQKARALRGDEGPLGNFSIELLEDGFRAIDPVSRIRYLVKRAPEDAPLTTTMPAEAPAPSSKADAPAAKASPAAAAKVETPDPEIPPPPKARAMAQTIAFTSPGSAMVSEPAKAAPAAPTPAPAAAAAPTPAPAATVGRTRKPAQTIAYSSTGSAAVLDAAAKIESARAAAPAAAPAAAAPAAAAPAAAAPAAAAPVAAPRPAAPPAAPALPSYTLVNEREDKPSERSPLSYREHVYAVAPGTPDDDVKRLILERFESVRQSLEQARPGKLINLAIFDHVFQGRPLRRPLVTLSWKDWKNEPPELQYPARDGVSVPPPAGPASASSPPASAPVASQPVAAAPAKVAPAAPAPAPASEPTPATKKTAPAAPVAAKPAPAAPVAAKPAPEAPVAAKPAAAPAPPRPTPASARSGAPAPSSTKPARAAAAAPTTPQKRLSGEDLLTELFEAFSDLHFLRDAIEGAEFVLALTLEKLPSEVGLISLFDMNKREFVVVRQTGGKQRVVGQRLPEKAPLATSAMRKRTAVVLSKADEVKGVADARFQAIGVELRSLVCAPVELGGRYLGLIELLNPLDGSLFNEGDGNALTYIGQQFAEFAAARGVMIDPEQLKESAGAAKSTPASSKRS